MEQIIAQYNGKPTNCVRYTKDDEANILAIVPAWRDYVKMVRLIGKSPQISSAFSQAFCCLKFNLVNRKSDGADAFKLGKNDRVVKVIELKATATINKRNDIKVYSGDMSLRERRKKPVIIKPDIEFNELLWFAANLELTEYVIYRFLPRGILEYDQAELPNIRAGRININFKKLVDVTNSKPYRKGAL